MIIDLTRFVELYFEHPWYTVLGIVATGFMFSFCILIFGISQSGLK